VPPGRQERFSCPADGLPGRRSPETGAAGEEKVLPIGFGRTFGIGGILPEKNAFPCVLIGKTNFFYKITCIFF